jgi:hypothetical protein
MRHVTPPLSHAAKIYDPLPLGKARLLAGLGRRLDLTSS